MAELDLGQEDIVGIFQKYLKNLMLTQVKY